MRNVEHETNLSLRACQEQLAQTVAIAEEGRRHANATRDALQYDFDKRVNECSLRIARIQELYDMEQIDNLSLQETIEAERLEHTAARAELDFEKQDHDRTKKQFDNAYNAACEAMKEVDRQQEQIKELENSLQEASRRGARVTELEILLQGANNRRGGVTELETLHEEAKHREARITELEALLEEAYRRGAQVRELETQLNEANNRAEAVTDLESRLQIAHQQMATFEQQLAPPVKHKRSPRSRGLQQQAQQLDDGAAHDSQQQRLRRASRSRRSTSGIKVEVEN